MFKKIFIGGALLACGFLTSPAQAGLYLGGGPGIQNTEGYNGVLATLFGGYSLLAGCNKHFYFAGEIFGDSGTLPLGQKYYRRTNYGLGASFLPGLILRETILVYLRMGIETFRYSTTLQRFTGGQLGAGLQTDFSTNWALRGEYIYTGEGIIKNFGMSRFNFFKIGLIYKFS